MNSHTPVHMLERRGPLAVIVRREPGDRSPASRVWVRLRDVSEVHARGVGSDGPAYDVVMRGGASLQLMGTPDRFVDLVVEEDADRWPSNPGTSPIAPIVPTSEPESSTEGEPTEAFRLEAAARHARAVVVLVTDELPEVLDLAEALVSSIGRAIAALTEDPESEA